MDETLASIIAAVAAVIGMIGTGLFARSRTMSSSAVDYVGVYSDLINRLQAELADEREHRETLEAEVEKLRKTVAVTDRRMKRLEAFIRLNTEFDPEQINGPKL